MQARIGTYITAKDISKKFKGVYPTINHYTNLGFFSIVKRRLDLISKMVNEGYPLRLIRPPLTVGFEFNASLQMEVAG